jgi:hypothetical protein
MSRADAAARDISAAPDWAFVALIDPKPLAPCTAKEKRFGEREDDRRSFTPIVSRRRLDDVDPLH